MKSNPECKRCVCLCVLQTVVLRDRFGHDTLKWANFWKSDRFQNPKPILAALPRGHAPWRVHSPKNVFHTDKTKHSLIRRLRKGIWFWMVEPKFDMRVSKITVWNKVCYRPLCWNHKFQNLQSDVKLRNERFPYWIYEEFQTLNGWNIPWTKVVDFESLGALLGPGAPDPDLLRFVLKLNAQDNA